MLRYQVTKTVETKEGTQTVPVKVLRRRLRRRVGGWSLVVRARSTNHQLRTVNATASRRSLVADDARGADQYMALKKRGFKLQRLDYRPTEER